MKRREFIKYSSVLSTLAGLKNITFPESLYGQSDSETPFILYLHLGSICGMASGLVQPQTAGKWFKGAFVRQSDQGAANPLLNAHHQFGSLVFHDYNKFLGDIANDMCLVNGTSQSLDHNVARPLQMRGALNSPEWAIGVAQGAKDLLGKSPLAISRGQKVSSCPDVRLLQAKSLEELKRFSADPATMPKLGASPIWNTLKNRYKKPAVGSIALNDGFGDGLSNQLDTLINGLPELASADDSVAKLIASLEDTSIRSVLDSVQDGKNVAIDQNLKNVLILAGTLAKTNLAQGLTADGINGQDFHNGGADVKSARSASGFWAQVKLFWQWIKAEGLDKKVTIIVSHEFGRSPYNNNLNESYTIQTSSGDKTFVAPGRDHGLFMGSIFINSGVPKSGRIGNIIDNLTPAFGTDSFGGIELNKAAFTSEDIVGSMMLRLYPQSFSDERSIRRFWPTFSKIDSLF